MHRFLKVAVVATIAACPVFPVAAHDGAHGAAAGAPFALISHAPRTLSNEDISQAEAAQTKGALAGTTLTYEAQVIRLVVRTGPEDDMLSYRIQGVRNPTLVVPKGAVLSVLFINTDVDMPHDIHFGSLQPPFPIAPGMEGAVGSSRLEHGAGGKYLGEELVVRAEKEGAHTYFCSIRGHAKGGMFGTLAVGAAPRNAASTPSAHTHEDGGHSHGDDAHGDEHGATHNDSHQDAGAHSHGDGGHGDGHGDSHGSMAGGAGSMASDSMMMRSSTNLADPMARESSGTAWVPDSSPIYAKMKMRGSDMLMLHGEAFPRYTSIGGERDVSVAGKGSRSRFDAPSMFMGMYSHLLSQRSQVGVRIMASLDPLIERGYGYPLLYQSGEVYKGQPLHDRQHPHDLISELSVTYSRRVGQKNSAYLYVGYPGEPALGPPTFMHRRSGLDTPDAPISHHWQDSTHITYGVVTAGYSLGKLKLEGSAFKGEEPNENRYDFDSPRLDSFSGRLSWNPNANLALQVSHGYLKKPEPAEPEITSRHRTTASVLHNTPLRGDANWANSLVWGQNSDAGEGRTNSYLFETNYQRRANTFYARLERVQKSGHELVLPAPNDHGVFGVGSYSVGYVRDLKRNSGLDVGLGAQATFGTNPSALSSIYGGRSHTGFQVFFRIRPSRLRNMDMSGMNMGGAMSGPKMP